MGCTLAQGTLVSDLLLKAEGKEAVLRGSAIESGDRSQRRALGKATQLSLFQREIGLIDQPL